MPQSSYTVNPPAGLAGQTVNAKSFEATTLVNTTASPIQPGKFVIRGPNPREMKLPAASGDVTGGKAKGFVMLRDVQVNTSNITNDDRGAVQVNEAGPVMQQGEMWVPCETAFTAGDKPFVRFTANGAGKDPGNIRNDDDTLRAVECQFARFVNSGIAGEMAHIRFNIQPA